MHRDTFKHHRDNFNYPQQQNDSNNWCSLKKSSGDSPTTMCGGHRAEDVIASSLFTCAAAEQSDERADRWRFLLFHYKVVWHSWRERPPAFAVSSISSSLICWNHWSWLCCCSILGFHSCWGGSISSETSGASVKHERTFTDSDFVIYSIIYSGTEICHVFPHCLIPSSFSDVPFFCFWNV